MDRFEMAGFIPDQEGGYLRRWIKGEGNGYIVAMSTSEGAPTTGNWLLSFSVCDGMESILDISCNDGMPLDDAITLFDEVEAGRLPPALFAPILTLEEGKAWITALHEAGLVFHFDDSTEDIIWKGGPLNRAENALLSHQRDMLYADLDWSKDGGCPIGFALELMEKAEAK